MTTKKRMFPRKKNRLLKKTVRSVLLYVICFFVLVSVSCASKKEVKNKQPAPSETVAAATEIEAEINAYRVADFKYIYTIKRKDGKPMDAEDKRFVKENSHFYTNRFTLVKDETVIFTGSNFKFDEKALEALKSRFEVEDYSKPEKPDSNKQTDSNKKVDNSNG